MLAFIGMIVLLLKSGREQERANTERERVRADQYQAENERLRALLRENGINPVLYA